MAYGFVDINVIIKALCNDNISSQEEFVRKRNKNKKTPFWGELFFILNFTNASV